MYFCLCFFSSCISFHCLLACLLFFCFTGLFVLGSSFSFPYILYTYPLGLPDWSTQYVSLMAAFSMRGAWLAFCLSCFSIYLLGDCVFTVCSQIPLFFFLFPYDRYGIYWADWFAKFPLCMDRVCIPCLFCMDWLLYAIYLVVVAVAALFVFGRFGD